MNIPTILVVDETPAILTIIKLSLERAGFSVITAEDGLQGWAVYKRHSSVIRLLLTDVDTPNMAAAEMSDRIQRDNPDLPVIFMSGNAPFSDPGWSCLAKPFRYAQLLAKVRMALEPRGTLKSSGAPLRETSELPL